MQGLHFSTTDLRNKLSRGHITNNCLLLLRSQWETMLLQKLEWRSIPLPSSAGMK